MRWVFVRHGGPVRLSAWECGKFEEESEATARTLETSKGFGSRALR
jgi:hypothetical protein